MWQQAARGCREWLRVCTQQTCSWCVCMLCSCQAFPDGDQFQGRVTHVSWLTAVDGPHATLRQNHGATAGRSWTQKSEESRSDHGPGGAGKTLVCGRQLQTLGHRV